jgi:transposase
MRWGINCGRCRRAAHKKIPETAAIFDRLTQVNAEADADERLLRLSLDAKATVLIGDYSRGGRSRLIVKAADHDFHPEEKVTPFGVFLPQYHELYLYFTPSKVTSDFIVDCLQQFWQSQKHRFPQVETLLLNLDNGPENHSRRTQFMQRITDFVDEFLITVDLAYYPPYHSKYNPIERVWGVLEQHWNGTLLDSCQTVLKFAQTMRYKGRSPFIQLVQKIYHNGVRLTQREMAKLEKRFDRLQALPKWFVTITPASAYI